MITNREAMKRVALGMRAYNRDRFNYWDSDLEKVNVLEESKAMRTILRSWIEETSSKTEKAFLQDYVDILEEVIADEDKLR